MVQRATIDAVARYRKGPLGSVQLSMKPGLPGGAQWWIVFMDFQNCAHLRIVFMYLQNYTQRWIALMYFQKRNLWKPVGAMVVCIYGFSELCGVDAPQPIASRYTAADGWRPPPNFPLISIVAKVAPEPSCAF